MSFKRILLLALLVATIIVTIIYRPRPPGGIDSGDRYPRLIVETNQPSDPPPPPVVNTQAVRPIHSAQARLKTRFSDFTSAEKEQFEKDFQEKYRPAIERWAKAYEGRIPFDLYDLTTDQFVERIFNTSYYREYVFVVDGITLGVRDASAGVRVDYLNAPEQTSKLAMSPGGSPPIVKPAVGREDIEQMVRTDDGVTVATSEIRITPTGLSGALNGGAFVHVGGDPDNGASWKYDIVFGSDGKLAFYRVSPRPIVLKVAE